MVIVNTEVVWLWINDNQVVESITEKIFRANANLLSFNCLQ